MKPWTKRSLLVAGSLLLGACAMVPKPDAGPAEKPVLPADYAAALDLMKNERWSAAETALQAYAQAHPQMSSPQVNLALLYLRTDREDAARAALAKALEINPKQAAAHNQLGILAREQGDFAGARKAYQAAIDADPQYPNAHLNLAILLDLYQHQPKAALRHYERYAELIGEDALEQNVKSWIADVRRQSQGD